MPFKFIQHFLIKIIGIAKSEKRIADQLITFIESLTHKIFNFRIQIIIQKTNTRIIIYSYLSTDSIFRRLIQQIA